MNKISTQVEKQKMGVFIFIYIFFERYALESISELRFRRFLENFWPIFDSKSPKNRPKLNLEIDS